MINSIKDYLLKLYLASIVFIFVLIACFLTNRPAIGFAIDYKCALNDAMMLSNVVQGGEDVPLKNKPNEIKKITNVRYINNYKYFVNSPKERVLFN